MYHKHVISVFKFSKDFHFHGYYSSYVGTDFVCISRTLSPIVSGFPIFTALRVALPSLMSISLCKRIFLSLPLEVCFIPGFSNNNGFVYGGQYAGSGMVGKRVPM